MKKNAFVILHFGSIIKYLEYEMYLIKMLESISKNDIIYLYSIIDTPESFVEIIKKMKVKTFGFDDSIIIEKINKFHSIYDRFNLLRISCFVYGNLLTNYDKICIVESDIILYKGFEKVFDLNIPCAYFHNTSKKESITNFKKKINSDDVLKDCNNQYKSLINGGVLLFKPDINIFPKFEKILNIVLKYKCIFPNEAIFVLLYDYIYNLPINFNMRRFTNHSNIEIYGRHFDCTAYKPLDIIKDNYLNKMKINVTKESILYFKKKFYDKYNKQFSKKLSKIILNNIK